MEQRTVTRRYPSLILGAVLGGVTILPMIALSYLGFIAVGLPFIPFDLFDWLARVLPGNLITIGIDSMVRTITALGLGPIGATAKTLEQMMGVVIVIAAGTVAGGLMAWLSQHSGWSGSRIGATLGLLGFLFMVVVEVGLKGNGPDDLAGSLLWLAVLTISWGALAGNWIAASASPMAASAGYNSSRRAMLIQVAGGAIGVALVASGLGKWLDAQRQASGAGQALSTLAPSVPQPASNSISAAPTVVPTPASVPTQAAEAAVRDRVPAAPGTRAELTATQDFYRVDINALPPVVDKATWKLDVLGLFDRPRSLTLSDLAAYPAVTQTITQSCISNPIAGDLIGTVNYTGARLRDVLKDLGIRPEARALNIKAADGFYESVVMEDMLDPRTLLVYGLNGATLPVDHGFPLRIYIPNRYGMKQPKWITSIEAIDHNGPGYWVERGWSLTAFPQIISVIDTVAKDKVENGRIPIGGIAWAGDRGIKKVEVQVDGGDWVEAVLRTPPLSPLTWVQWRYDWPSKPGSHKFTVRATDGTGTLQNPTSVDTYPDGATGYHSVTENIS